MDARKPRKPRARKRAPDPPPPPPEPGPNGTAPPLDPGPTPAKRLAAVLTDLMPCQSAADVPTGPARWLVEGFVPDGSVTLLDGRKGSGKSSVMASWASRIALRYALTGRRVLWSVREENLGTQTRPRLNAAGCHLDLITFPGSEPGSQTIARPFVFPQDFLLLRRLVAATGARMLVLDPLSSHVSADVNLNMEQHARAVMDPLLQLAAESNVVVLCSRHVGKSKRDDLDAGLGSVALTATARSVCHVRRITDTGPERVLLHVAGNIGAAPRPVLFRLEGAPNGAPRVAWGPEIDPDDPRLAERPPDRAERDALADALAFLRAELGEEDLPARVVANRGLDAGISPTTLRRAKEQLRITSYAEGARGSRIWFWKLPRDGDHKDDKVIR